MANPFSSILLRRPKTSKFDLSYDVKFTMNMGDLVPCHVQEVVPGDSFELGCQSLIRFAPLISPVMHRMDAYTHYFFVPSRILWKGFETFITGSKNGKKIPETDIPPMPTTYPYNSVDAFNEAKRLMDYMGLPFGIGAPPQGGKAPDFSILPFLAYQKIWDEYYRDQNLQDSIFDDEHLVSDGENDFNAISNTILKLRKRAWRHDYFTSALPFAQKGDAVTLPILQDQQDLYVRTNYNDPAGSSVNWTGTSAGGNKTVTASPRQMGDPNAQSGALFVEGEDLQNKASTINDLRTAFRLQEWLEKAARAGSRYFEVIEAFFGRKTPDARLQRPEYIGGSKTPVIISEVLQTSESQNTPQANMAGHGISFDKGGYSRYSCAEHGYIIGVMSVMPQTAYQQGIPRHFSKFDRFDFLWPEFAHLGEQEILNKELFVSNSSRDDETFGYIPRYSEYRYNPSRVAGNFRDNLAFWHLGRIFDSAPALNAQFIESNPSKRIFAVTDPNVDSLYCQVFHTINAYRPLPKYGTPFGV